MLLINKVFCFVKGVYIFFIVICVICVIVLKIGLFLFSISKFFILIFEVKIVDINDVFVFFLKIR